MKNLRNYIALIITLLAVSTTFAQENEKSLLWKIEGNGIKTSYIFGTFHMLPKRDFIIKEKVKSAFETTSVTVLELDMDDPTFQTEMINNAMIKDGKTINEFMDADEYSIIDKYLTEKMGVGLAQFKSFKPLMVSSAVMMAFIGNDVASYEASLIGLTKEQNREIKGLETVAEQMNIFDEQPYDEQLDDIVKLLKEEGMLEMFNAMISHYKNEDIDELYNYMGTFYNQEQLDRMLHIRNQNWIPKIGTYSKEKAAFYGVGAGHLGGAKGVINLLREAGYTVTPILD
ncbi:TraB/GumN family protein [Rasiella rasia]|uniref:TraB/GumN family protein n=1 Tax=Rasiella rasia TaxID=2744027 RepID=A0A6G6GND2_9FLAO|nr:TraB/GumN family protein [Rasiella rasia]QIE60000.1 TraB/GumN family protein [Rasiella rasia]